MCRQRRGMNELADAVLRPLGVAGGGVKVQAGGWLRAEPRQIAVRMAGMHVLRVAAWPLFAAAGLACAVGRVLRCMAVRKPWHAIKTSGVICQGGKKAHPTLPRQGWGVCIQVGSSCSAAAAADCLIQDSFNVFSLLRLCPGFCKRVQGKPGCSVCEL